MTLTTFLEKPAFRMIRRITSTHEDGGSRGLDETSSVVEPEDSTPMEVRYVHRQEGIEGLQTTPSEVTAEPAELTGVLSRLAFGRELAQEAQMAGRHRHADCPMGVEEHSAFMLGEPELEICTAEALCLPLVANKLRWGRLKMLQIPLNTLGRRDHYVGRTWSARMFFLRGMYHANN